jgi:hypothetical protein
MIEEIVTPRAGLADLDALLDPVAVGFDSYIEYRLAF